jgi:hypothetical protein
MPQQLPSSSLGQPRLTTSKPTEPKSVTLERVRKVTGVSNSLKTPAGVRIDKRSKHECKAAAVTHHRRRSTSTEAETRPIFKSLDIEVLKLPKAPQELFAPRRNRKPRPTGTPVLSAVWCKNADGTTSTTRWSVYQWELVTPPNSPGYLAGME